MMAVNLQSSQVTQGSPEFDAQPAFVLPLMLPAGVSFDWSATFTPSQNGFRVGLLGNNGPIFAEPDRVPSGKAMIDAPSPSRREPASTNASKGISRTRR